MCPSSSTLISATLLRSLEGSSQLQGGTQEVRMLWAMAPQGLMCLTLRRGPRGGRGPPPFPALPLIPAGPEASPADHLMDLFPHPHLCMKSGHCHNMALNKRRCRSPTLPPTEGPSQVRTNISCKGLHVSAWEGTYQLQGGGEAVQGQEKLMGSSVFDTLEWRGNLQSPALKVGLSSGLR